MLAETKHRIRPEHFTCLIREQPWYRREAFITGLKACGLTQVEARPAANAVLIVWNRYGHWDQLAAKYERAGGTVLVAENGYLGRDWRGGHWYAISRGQHNGAGWWPEGGPERWNGFGINFEPWRKGGSEVVLLPQRGIGPPGVTMPASWVEAVRRQLPSARLRPHPGEGQAVPLEQDLQNARCVVTWGSGAALKALLAGVPVFHSMPNWIGAGAAAQFAGDASQPVHGDRLRMFQRLAWAMWSVEEIASGEPFRRLLSDSGQA